MDSENRERKSLGLTPLENMLDRYVQIITADGRIFVGYLKGLDQALNAIISDSEERIFSKEIGVKIEKLGLFMIRGDNIAVIGEVDEEIDSVLDYNSIKAEPIKPIVN